MRIWFLSRRFREISTTCWPFKNYSLSPPFFIDRKCLIRDFSFWKDDWLSSLKGQCRWTSNQYCANLDTNRGRIRNISSFQTNYFYHKITATWLFWWVYHDSKSSNLLMIRHIRILSSTVSRNCLWSLEYTADYFDTSRKYRFHNLQVLCHYLWVLYMHWMCDWWLIESKMLVNI